MDRRASGPKLKQMLRRGVGVHHAGLLPKYRRVVEDLFTQKLLAVVVCTETLAAGINLPARSVVLTSLVKGPRGKEKLIDASTAHQIFGRAGRPQFDDRGFVYALAHEDDVAHPPLEGEVRSDPRGHARSGPSQGEKGPQKEEADARATTRSTGARRNSSSLQAAPPGKLYSKGPLPWRLLAYLLEDFAGESRRCGRCCASGSWTRRGWRPARSSSTACC